MRGEDLGKIRLNVREIEACLDVESGVVDVLGLVERNAKLERVKLSRLVVKE